MSKAIMGAAMLAGDAAMLAAGVVTAGGSIGLMEGLQILMGNSLFQSLALGGVAMEAGAIADALTQNRGMGITSRQPAANRQIIYGEQRIGGVMVYESTTGGKNDQYNMIIVLATHEIDSIVNLYLDGRRVNWQGSGAGWAAGPGGTFFGGAAGGGTFIGPGGQHYNFDTLVYCEARYGNQADGDVIGGMTANDPTWGASASGAPYLGGCTYIYLKVEYDTSMFPQQPEVRLTVRGKNNIVDPRLTPTTPATPPTVLARPTVLTNGWGANAQNAAYEEGVDQGYGWGLNSSATPGYGNPADAVDGSLTTAASISFQHEHQYAGCIWSFPALTSEPSTLYLNINSMVNPYVSSGRSAGVWYSLDGGTTWTQIYNTPNHAQYWDSILLSPSQDTSLLRVMAFTDAHDDMAHFVYDIQVATAAQVNTSDPTNGTGVFTTNWALIVADIIQDDQWGLGDIGAVNVEQLIAAANVCDEQITLAQGSTEAQWTCNWHYDTSTSPGNALQSVMSAAAGRLSRIGGEWYIWPAYWQGPYPAFTFSEGDLTGKTTWKPYRKFRELFNRITGTYIAANNPYNIAGNLYDQNGWFDGTIQNNFPFAFQPTNYPQYAQDVLHGYASDQWLAQDGGIQLPREVTQPCVLSVAQAQRAAKVMLLRNRWQGTGTLKMNLKAWQMQPLDVMEINMATQNWVNKVLEVSATRFSVVDGPEGEQLIEFECDVQETDLSVYEWSPSEELSVYDVPANPQVGVPYSVPAPINLTVESDATTALVAADGTVTPQLLISWTPSPDPTVVGYNIQYQIDGSGVWINAPSAAASQTYAYVGGVTSGYTYDVQIRAVRLNGATSVWVSSSSNTAGAPTSSSSTYSTSPSPPLTSPSSTEIDMAAVTLTYTSPAKTATYAARTFSITAPSEPTSYYVTIADATGDGESGTMLSATCQTSDSLIGTTGNVFIGYVTVFPPGWSGGSGGGYSGGSGWPIRPVGTL